MAIMLSSIYFSSDEKLFGAMAAVDSIFSDVEDQLGLLCALDSRRSEAIKYIRDMYFIPTELSERIYNRYIDIVLKES